MLLQGRGKLTAQQIADELEISLRTVYRDLEALGEAGVPLFADRGPAGGYSLVEGYRTRLTGLTANEAEAVFLAGLPGPAAELGLGASLATAELKLRAALPAGLRERAARIADRFHLDHSEWFREAEQPRHLQALAEAVWEQRRLRVHYARWRGQVERVLEPLGIVLKGSSWYLVAAVAGQPRTYRAARMLDVALLEEHFERPAGFDLAAFWAEWSRDFEMRLARETAEIRLSPLGLKIIEHIFNAATQRAVQASRSVPDADGWVHATIPMESVPYAASELLRLGAEVEVLGPPGLRERMREIVRVLGQRYGCS